MKLDSSIVNKKLETTSRRHCPRVNSIKRVDRHHSLGSVPVAPTKPPSNPIHEQSPIFGNQEKIRCVGNYDIGRTIGKGKFGTVKIATHVLTGDVVAVKIINKQKLDELGLKMLQHEIKTLKTLSHPNIIQLYEVMETDKVLFLIMEHASGGEALDYVVAHGRIAEDKARDLFRQIISAVSYCHRNRIVHRDLKAENLLLDRGLQIKLIDFGLSSSFSENELLNTPCGSPVYAAPEIIKSEKYNGTKVDIWCMGIILYVFLVGKLPFKAPVIADLFEKILAGDYTIPDFLSNESKDLIKSMLCLNAENRITMEQIINHKWVQGTTGWILPTVDSKLEKIDPDIVSTLETMGFSADDVMESVKNKDFNQAAATFKLLSRQRSTRSFSISNDPYTSKLAIPLSGYVDGITSTPSTTTNTPSSSVSNSPSSSYKNIPFQATGNNRDSLNERKRRVMERRKRGHQRTRSEIPQTTTINTIQQPSIPNRDRPTSEANGIPLLTVFKTTTEPDTKKQFAPRSPRSPHSPHSPRSPRSPLSPRSKLVLDKKLEQVLHDKPLSESLDSKSNWVTPHKPTKKTHRRYNSEAGGEAQFNFDSITKEPATKPLWNDINQSQNTPVKQEIPLVRKLTEQELQNWKNDEESERKQITSNTPKRSFNSIISWTKQMLQKKPQQVMNEPREVRTLFSSSTTSRKPPQDIMTEIKRVLGLFDILFEENSPYCLKAHCTHDDIQFEIEVCSPPNLSDIYVIRLRRISGECQLVLSNLNL